MSFKVCKYMCVQKANVGSNKKATGYQQLYIVSYSRIKRNFSDEHITTFNSSPKSRPPQSSESIRMRHLAFLLPTSSKQFKLPRHRFKWRQNAPFSWLFSILLSSSSFENVVSNSIKMHHFFLLFKNFSAVPTSRTSFQIAAECTIYRLWFQKLLSCSNFRKIFTYSVRIHHLLSLLSTCSHHFQLPKTSFKMPNNAPFSVISLANFGL